MLRTASIALSCALIALAVGLWLGGHPGGLPGPVRDAFVSDDRALRSEVADAIEDNFYRRVNEDRLEDASLKGMVAALDDPYSHYLTPREARQFRDSVEGEFDGVGMTVEQDRRGLRVLNVFDGSPARRAGIRRGELVVAVNGRSIAGLNSQLATARIKGRPGTRVRLELLDPATGRTRRLTLTRRRIEVPVAQVEIVERGGRKLAVIKLLSFSSGAHGFLRQEVERALREGATGIVLDLRGNGGGLLSEA
ncbi:MAG: S41 family peptidase, partial [Nocardioidaceae bacterium]